MRKKILLVFTALFLLLIKIDVSAECTSEDFNIYKQEAINLQFDFKRISKVDPADEKEYNYYNIKVSNITDDIMLTTDLYAYQKEDADDDGFINIDNDFIPGEKVVFYIRGSSSSKCKGSVILTKNIDVPYFNEYSTRPECSGLENYDICSENTNTSTISEEKFLQYIDQAKKKELEKNKPNEVVQEKRNFLNEIIDFIKNNTILFVLIVAMIILLIVVIIIVIIKKNRSKIKIDI